MREHHPQRVTLPNVPRHAVQFFDGDERALARNVARFLADGLQRGERALIVAGGANSRAILAELARCVDAENAVAANRLMLLDAARTLESIMVDGRPDPRRFREAIGMRVRAFKGADVRAYGELVGLLWEDGNRDGAAALEALWNEELARERCRLFCGYAIDVFGDEFRPGDLDAVLRAHTHVVASGGDDAMGAAIDRAMDEVLAARSGETRRLLALNVRPAWPAVPRGEGLALWLRHTLPGVADEILTRAKTYYRTPRA